MLTALLNVSFAIVAPHIIYIVHLNFAGSKSRMDGMDEGEIYKQNNSLILSLINGIFTEKYGFTHCIECINSQCVAQHEHRIEPCNGAIAILNTNIDFMFSSWAFADAIAFYWVFPSLEILITAPDENNSNCIP